MLTTAAIESAGPQLILPAERLSSLLRPLAEAGLEVASIGYGQPTRGYVTVTLKRPVEAIEVTGETVTVEPVDTPGVSALRWVLNQPQEDPP